jgi:hypothetical protein
VLIRVRLKELSGNTNSLTRTNDRSFNDRVHVQFSRNFRQTLFLANDSPFLDRVKFVSRLANTRKEVFQGSTTSTAAALENLPRMFS